MDLQSLIDEEVSILGRLQNARHGLAEKLKALSRVPDEPFRLVSPEMYHFSVRDEKARKWFKAVFHDNTDRRSLLWPYGLKATFCIDVSASLTGEVEFYKHAHQVIGARTIADFYNLGTIVPGQEAFIQLSVADCLHSASMHRSIEEGVQNLAKEVQGYAIDNTDNVVIIGLVVGGHAFLNFCPQIA